MKKYRVTVNGKSYEVAVEEIEGTDKAVSVSADPVSAVSSSSSVLPASVFPPTGASAVVSARPLAAEVVSSPIPGKVLSLKVKEAQEVFPGDLLLILEAMKMENDIFCSCSGRVLEIRVSEGDHVNTGDVLVVIG